MHDIWNLWHGCKKISEGCKNCYMYYLDKVRNQDGEIKEEISQKAGKVKEKIKKDKDK